MKREQFTEQDIIENKERYLFTNNKQCDYTNTKSQEQVKTPNWMQVEDLQKQKDYENQKII